MSSGTTFKRTDAFGNEYDWIAFHADDDLLSSRMVGLACENLHVLLEALDLGTLNRPVVM